MLPTKKTVAIAIALTLSVPALTSSALAQTKAEKPAAKAAATPKVEGKVSVNGVIIPQAFFDAMNREREASGQAASPGRSDGVDPRLL